MTARTEKRSANSAHGAPTLALSPLSHARTPFPPLQALCRAAIERWAASGEFSRAKAALGVAAAPISAAAAVLPSPQQQERQRQHQQQFHQTSERELAALLHSRGLVL